MVRLTDRPDMTLDVYRGRKTTKQQKARPVLLLSLSWSHILWNIMLIIGQLEIGIFCLLFARLYCVSMADNSLIWCKI